MRFQAIIVAAGSIAQLALGSPMPEPTPCPGSCHSWYAKPPTGYPTYSPSASWYHKRDVEATATADGNDNSAYARPGATAAVEV